ncbi:MAG: MFS transporter, partial [Halodesulfurarchaeum sp.]
TVLWGIYALLQYPSGRLSDRLSRKTLLVAGLALLAIGFLAVGLAPTYPLFLLGAAIIGVGSGLYPTSARALVSDLFVERRGAAFGLHSASGDLGGVAAAGLATLVISVAVWRTAFVPLVVVAVLVALGIHWWSREAYVVSRPELAIGRTVRRLLGQAENRWLLVAYILFAFTWQAATGFLPTYLQLGKGFSPLIANTAFAVLFGVGVLVKPLAGSLADRFRRERMAVASLALAAASLVLVIVAASPLLVVLGVVTFAAGLLSYPPVMQAFLMDTFPDASYGGDLGAMRSIYIGLGALGPTYVGSVAAVANYDLAFAGLVAALVVAGVLIATTASGSGSV